MKIRTPDGLEDVSKFPNLFATLIETGRWSESDLEKLAGRNALRVLQEVEAVRHFGICMYVKRREFRLIGAAAPKLLGWHFSLT